MLNFIGVSHQMTMNNKVYSIGSKNAVIDHASKIFKSISIYTFKTWERMQWQKTFIESV